jgi:hypothetical protein
VVPGFFADLRITGPNRVRARVLAVPHVCHVQDGGDVDDAPPSGVHLHAVADPEDEDPEDDAS